MLAFKHAFLKTYPQMERVDCVIAGKMPDVYHFMPGIKTVKNVETSQDLLAQYDLSISVDCGSGDRLGPAEPLFMGATVSVNIDHHISNKCFGKLNIVIPEAAASGEVVADLLKVLDIPLDADIATCLYTALVTDTGGFKYSNASAKAFRLGSDLVAAGANPELIFKQIYEERPKAQVMVHADAVLRAEFNADKTLSWTTVTRQDLDRFGALEEHIDGIVESLRQIDSVLVSAVFKETAAGDTKVSLRSDSHDINVSAVVEPLNGGGHKMAAGCTITQPPDAARAIVLPELEAAIQAARAKGNLVNKS